MIISVILAISNNGVIGDRNTLPWHLPDDLRNFRRLTLDKSVIMGRRTWESLPGPLPRRRCIVVSSRAIKGDGEQVGSPQAALDLCAGEAEVMAVGGVGIYRHFLPRCTRLYLTRVAADIAGDTRLPELDLSEFELQQETHHPADGQHAHAFTHQEFRRI